MDLFLSLLSAIIPVIVICAVLAIILKKSERGRGSLNNRIKTLEERVDALEKKGK